MDSGNSGSMQSSSTAGDEEYDSRAESSISAFLNNNNNNPVPPPQPTALTHVGPFATQHHHTHVFDPLSNYLDPTQRSQLHPNHILNLDMVWSKVARSEPDLGGGLIPCSSSSSPHNNNNNQAFLLTQLGGGQSQTRGGGVAVAVPASAFPTTLPPESASPRGGLLSVSAANEQNSTNTNTNTNVVRNPKKRSRASRRAPTTVLTTDTTNFRAMVQEFTGIPAPPFTSSPFPRTRLDLFTSSSAIRSASTHLDPPTTTTPPPYLLRPFAQKVQALPSSIPAPSSFPPMLDTLASNSSPNNNYPLSMHNPILSLQSILQPPPKYPSLLVGSKTQQQQQQPSLETPPSGVDSHLKMGGLEELGLSHSHVGGHHQNMVSSSSDGASLSRVNNNINSNMRGPSSADWAQAQRIGNNEGGVLRSLSGALNYRSNVPDQRVSNGKVNFSSAPSDFHGDKGPDCAVAARSEENVQCAA
ncbi:Modulating plastid sigma factor [Spatholobus suberectus]|nr:Modulating plastid sigma factor [Spatholobus suberectus]